MSLFVALINRVTDLSAGDQNGLLKLLERIFIDGPDESILLITDHREEPSEMLRCSWESAAIISPLSVGFIVPTGPNLV